MSEGTGPPGGIPPAQARNYFGDVLTGLIYLHSQVGVGGWDGVVVVGDWDGVGWGGVGLENGFREQRSTTRNRVGNNVWTSSEIDCTRVDRDMSLWFQNVVHGDIKPENLLMSAEGRVVISDFGVSHKLQVGRSTTHPKSLPTFVREYVYSLPFTSVRPVPVMIHGRLSI